LPHGQRLQPPPTASIHLPAAANRCQPLPTARSDAIAKELLPAWLYTAPPPTSDDVAAAKADADALPLSSGPGPVAEAWGRKVAPAAVTVDLGLLKTPETEADVTNFIIMRFLRFDPEKGEAVHFKVGWRATCALGLREDGSVRMGCGWGAGAGGRAGSRRAAG
jgi:hypothetical protein